MNENTDTESRFTTWSHWRQTTNHFVSVINRIEAAEHIGCWTLLSLLPRIASLESCISKKWKYAEFGEPTDSFPFCVQQSSIQYIHRGFFGVYSFLGSLHQDENYPLSPVDVNSTSQLESQMWTIRVVDKHWSPSTHKRHSKLISSVELMC